MKNFDELQAALLAADYEETGGGNDFLSYSRAPSQDVFLFCGARGSGPETTHWVAVDRNDQDLLTAGGFTAASLAAWLKSLGR